MEKKSEKDYLRELFEGILSYVAFATHLDEVLKEGILYGLCPLTPRLICNKDSNKNIH